MGECLSVHRRVRGALYSIESDWLDSDSEGAERLSAPPLSQRNCPSSMHCPFSSALPLTQRTAPLSAYCSSLSAVTLSQCTAPL